MLIPGRATPDATRALAEKSAYPASYRPLSDGLLVSNIGLGTGRGGATDEIDAAYRETIGRALALGCTLIDTAVQYRHQRSERVIGALLQEAHQAGTLQRESLILTSKGGYVPFDRTEPDDPREFAHREYVETGLAHPNEFAADYRHCIAPGFLERQIDLSRENLGVETLDMFYLHNPETQRIVLSHDTFRRRMLDAFETLEQAVERGHIASYGLATWTGFRCPPKAPEYLSMAELVGIAYEVAGDAHHLRCVQLPYNALMPEAFAMENQQVNELFLSPIAAAAELGLSVITSASLREGRLAHPLVPQLVESFPELPSDAARALQFARSTPGVAAALVGTCDVTHLEEDLHLLSRPIADSGTILRLYSR